MTRGAIGLVFAAFVAATGSEAFGGGWIADAKSGCKVWNPNPQGGEAVLWTGACKNGVADGKGVLDWLRQGRPYERDEGEWRAGRQVGTGTQTWTGGHYEGALSDSMPNGNGVLTSGGARYDGAFVGGKPSGRGILTNTSGTFDGMWRDGCFTDGKRKAAIGTAVQSCP